MSNVDERAAERESKLKEEQQDQRRLARPEDYVYDKAEEQFWDLKNMTPHSEKAVDASIPKDQWRVEVTEPPAADPSAPPRRGRPAVRRERLIPPSQDIQRVENDQFVEGTTWWPGQPQIIRNWLVTADGAFESTGARTLNVARPLRKFKQTGIAAEAEKWTAHVRRLWPNVDEHSYFFDYCAHLLQRPQEKCNVAVVLSGVQGIGKDAALAPVLGAVGDYNFKGIEPDALFDKFQPWKQTLVLKIDEVRPSNDEHHASSMYNILKPLIATPPYFLPLNDKFAKLRWVINVMRIFITTNDHLALHIPPEDRRMFVLHSDLPSKWYVTAGEPDYFKELFDWFEKDGTAHVAAWLLKRDIRAFRPKDEAPRTATRNAIAESWGSHGDEVAEALERLGYPDVFFGPELLDGAFDDQDVLSALLKQPRKLVIRMQKSNYSLHRPQDGAQRWYFRDGGKTYRAAQCFVKKGVTGDVLAAIKAHGQRKAAAQPAPAQKPPLKMVR